MDARRSIVVLAAVLALAVTCGAAAQAQAVGESGFGQFDGGTAFSPRVPVSAFARPAAWFDPARLRVSTTVSVGTGWGGRTDALQVTSLSYQFAAPLAVRLSVGNAFGASAAERGRGMFLEGFQLAYRPHPSLQFNIDYRDLRSPLQYSPYPGFGATGR
ncbi:MAG: hypothetical protein AAB113_02225 [Candidatus Eisenbacteria bacterium]